METTKYEIFIGTLKVINTIINDRLKNGWVLYGDPFFTGATETISRRESKAVYGQAMTKTKV